MITVGLRDQLFAHAPFMSPSAPRRLAWDRSGEPHRITVFTDNNLDEAFTDPSPVKIAMLLEPPELHGHAYSAVADYDLAQRFDLILTHDEQLVRSGPKFQFMPFGGCWIDPADRSMRSKTKNLSIIASSKAQLEGHQLRHAVVQVASAQFDGIFGSAYQPVKDKIEALGEYRYSIVIENVRRNWFFTEKLIDAFVTATVPVYWGCPDIARFFDPDGMVIAETAQQIVDVLPQLTEEEYVRRLPAIHANFELAKRYACPEDYLARYILEPRYGVSAS